MVWQGYKKQATRLTWRPAYLNRRMQKAIAASLKRSANKAIAAKAHLTRVAMSMLNFYINVRVKILRKSKKALSKKPNLN